MTPVNQFYQIKAGDDFIPLSYPEVEEELTLIKQGVGHLHSIAKGEIIVSYFKDHCLKREWVKDYPELTALITSRHFKATHLQALFDSCRSNKAFLANFEIHIKDRVVSASQ